MKDSFIVFNAECVNPNQDCICRLAFTPVVNGKMELPKVFYVNPEGFWEFTSRAIDKDLCLASPKIKEIWPEIEKLIEPFDLLISTADGYSARVLWYHLTRTATDFKAIEYLNAKSISRKLFPDEFSFSFDLLVPKFCPQWAEMEEIESVTNGWASILLKGLENLECENLRIFAENNNMTIGRLARTEFVPPVTKRKRFGNSNAVDFSCVEINADPDNPFFEKNVVFTGKLEKLTRSAARKLVVSVGGEAPDNLTTATNYLVVGAQDLRVVGEKGLSGKMKKAAAYKQKGADIELIDENDFFEMINYK